MGYHNRPIVRGVFGESSKIREEFEEFEDAVDSGNRIMALVELADMIGAIEEYVKIQHRLTLEDLITMSDATRKAFKDGTRTTRS